MNVEAVLACIIGQTAWLPRKGVGTFLTIEFGKPMLVRREPILREGVMPRLRRPRVIVQGETHLWVQADEWRLLSELGGASSADEPVAMAQGLDVLAGQTLTGVELTTSGTEFAFEYGDRLVVKAGEEPNEAQWSVFLHGAGCASWLNCHALRVDEWEDDPT